MAPKPLWKVSFGETKFLLKTLSDGMLNLDDISDKKVNIEDFELLIGLTMQ